MYVVIEHDCHVAFTGNGQYYIRPRKLFTSKEKAEAYAEEMGKKGGSCIWEVFEIKEED
jgi:hypothetical protein